MLKGLFNFTSRASQVREPWHEVMQKMLGLMASKDSGERGWDRADWEQFFAPLYLLIKAELTNKTKEERVLALNELQTLLCTHLRLTEPARRVFAGDFKLYSYFLLVCLTPLDADTPELRLSELWAEEIEPQQRYHAMIGSLLSHVAPELKAGTYQNFAEVRNNLNAFQALSRLYLAPENTREAGQATVRERLQAWLLAISRWFRAFIEQKVTLDNDDYVEVCQQQWKLLQRFGLARQADYQETLQNIKACYEAVLRQQEKQAYYYLTKKSDGMWMRARGLTARVSIAWEIDYLVENLEQDLRKLEQWSQRLAQASLILPDKPRAEVYLDVYKQVQAKLDELSAAAFNFRRQHEQKWRQTPQYLNSLEKLDNRLRAFNKEIGLTGLKWRSQIEADYAGDEFYPRANEVLCALESETVRRLRWGTDWVHHTAYCRHNTEDELAFEMNAREKQGRFERYGLKTSVTMADFVVGSLAKHTKEVVKAVYLSVHPDRAQRQDDAEVRYIKEYCLKLLEGWRSEAGLLGYVWQQSQWQSVVASDALAIEVAPSQQSRQSTEPVDAPIEEVTHIRKPERALDLSILDLHADFITWMTLRSDLRKYTRDEVPFHHQFCVEKEDEELLRGIFEAGKDRYVQIISQLKRENALRDAALAEAAVARQEARAQEQKMRAQEQKMMIVIQTQLTRELEQRFVGAAMVSEAWVRQQFNESIKKLHGDFKTCVELSVIEGVACRIVYEDESFAGIRRFIAPPATEGERLSAGLQRYGTFPPPVNNGLGSTSLAGVRFSQ